MKIKYILIFVLLVASMTYLVFYPLRFDFYEQLKAKRIVDVIFVPVFIILLIYYVFKNVKKGDINWKIFPKELLFAVVLFGIVYFLILRSVFSCGLLFINSAFEEKEIVEIHGIITDIVNIEGHGKMIGKYELTVNQNGREFTFDSNKKALENFSLDEQFKIEMKKGILNLLYK